MCRLLSEILRLRWRRLVPGGALGALVLLSLTGCGDPVFINNENAVRTDTPTYLEDFVIHRYKGTTESLRIHGVQAVYNDHDRAILLDDVTLFMYSDEEGQNCQVATLRSNSAVLYLEDEQGTTSPTYRGNDIDFNDDVTLLDRRGRRMVTDKLRFINANKTYVSDDVTTIALLQEANVTLKTIDDSFSYHAGSGEMTGEGIYVHTLGDGPGEPGELMRLEIERQIAETPWSCGSDDTPLPTTPKESAP